jgi:hypothetical protein
VPEFSLSCANLCLHLLDRITVRQTRDPYVADIQYIAYSKITLPDNTGLCLNDLGFGQPGDKFIVRLMLHLAGFILCGGR